MAKDDVRKSKRQSKKEAEKKLGKKQSFAIAIFFIFWGLTMLILILVYSHIKTDKTPQHFNPAKKATAEKLYDSIMRYDLDSNYPVSPEIVMDIYNDTIRILYGDMIIDDAILVEVVEQQRKLLSPALLKENPLESQIAALNESLETLKKMKVYCVDASHKDPSYDRFNPDRCIIKTTQIFKNLKDVDRNYYFVKNPENGRWQIDDWSVVLGADATQSTEGL